MSLTLSQVSSKLKVLMLVDLLRAYLDSDAQNRGAEFNTRCRTNEAVDTAPIGQGGCAVAFTQENEWLEYTVIINESSTFNIDVALASPGGGGVLALSLDGERLVDEIIAPDTGGFDIFQPVTLEAIDLPAGIHVLRVDFLENGIGESEQTPGNLDYIAVIDPNARAPFLDIAQPIPGKIEAEYYDNGGAGVGYVDLTNDPVGSSGGDEACSRGDNVFLGSTGDELGGCAVGYTLAGEELHYTVNITESALYSLTARVANGIEATARGSFELLLEGSAISSTASIPFTGDFNEFIIIELESVNLEAGEHELSIIFNNNGDAQTPGNIDFIEFVRLEEEQPEQSAFVNTIISASEESVLNLGDYDLGGEGIAFSDTEEAQLAAINNDSTCRVDEAVDIATYDVCVLSYTIANEWVEYTINIEEAGLFDLAIGTYAGGEGGYFYLQFDGAGITPPIKVNSTGDFGTLGEETVENVFLDEGEHILRVFMLESGPINSVGNLREIRFSPNNF